MDSQPRPPRRQQQGPWEADLLLFSLESSAGTRSAVTRWSALWGPRGAWGLRRGVLAQAHPAAGTRPARSPYSVSTHGRSWNPVTESKCSLYRSRGAPCGLRHGDSVGRVLSTDGTGRAGVPAPGVHGSWDVGREVFTR